MANKSASYCHPELVEGCVTTSSWFDKASTRLSLILLILALVLALGACGNTVDPNAPKSAGPTGQPASGGPTMPPPNS